jgi:hypothetical protein
MANSEPTILTILVEAIREAFAAKLFDGEITR